ncbi:PAP-specific phosphatase HAL2-like protein [Gossypium australe]|uniref:3'(2'),5'-bisphosphate nucleotidase n=1 Tax=Gossypium australe TaxID=47621 RepID=A0A5B6W9Y5_9ROSI|nr:PAP-specific phosphatase HAL2-like protein [Gossypium australe]
MPLNCSTLGFRVPHLLPQTNYIASTTYLGSCFPAHRTKTHPHNFHIVSQLKSNQNFSSPSSSSSSSSVMEEQRELVVSPAQAQEAYAKELDVAIRAVQMASSLSLNLQHTSLHSKHDNSLLTLPGTSISFSFLLTLHLGWLNVTQNILGKSYPHTLISVAYACKIHLRLTRDSYFLDWSVHAAVSWILSESFGCQNVSILGNKDVQSLSKADAADLLDAVVKTVNDCLAEAPHFGLKGPETPLGSLDVLEAISRCNSSGGPTGRFWALGHLDGTFGFVRDDQYAVALALIEDGEVVLGVLGCPNYPMKKEWLTYHHRYHRILSKLTPPTSKSWDKGCVIHARKGSGEAWIQPIHQKNKLVPWANSAIRVQVSSIDYPALATFCEPIDKLNSAHSFTAGLAHSVGLRKQPLRVYSMVKYAAIARGDAEIFMKFARTGSKEKIWDHAAGVIIIQEAGGVVTDAGGSPLDFSKGMFLEGVDRGIIASAGAKLHEEIIIGIDASWNSSNL